MQLALRIDDVEVEAVRGADGRRVLRQVEPQRLRMAGHDVVVEPADRHQHAVVGDGEAVGQRRRQQPVATSEGSGRRPASDAEAGRNVVRHHQRRTDVAIQNESKKTKTVQTTALSIRANIKLFQLY